MKPINLFPTKESLDKHLQLLDELDDIKKRFLIAYEKLRCNATQACHAAGMATSSLYWHKNHDATFALQMRVIENGLGDQVEAKMNELIFGVRKVLKDKEGQPILDAEGKKQYTEEYAVPPNVAAVIFYCKTKLKDRGYIETVEHEVSVEKPVVIDWRRKVETNPDTPPTNE